MIAFDAGVRLHQQRAVVVDPGRRRRAALPIRRACRSHSARPRATPAGYHRGFARAARAGPTAQSELRTTARRDRPAGPTHPRSTSPARARRADRPRGCTLTPTPMITAWSGVPTASAFGEDAGQLALADHQVVRPLQISGEAGRGCDAVAHGNTGRECDQRQALRWSPGLATNEKYRPAPAARPTSFPAARGPASVRRRPPPRHGRAPSFASASAASIVDGSDGVPSHVEPRVGTPRAQRGDRRREFVRDHSAGSSSKLRSAAGAECVSAPIDT